MSNPTPPSLPQGILTDDQTAWLKRYVRSIPDYPQPGVLFRDITPLLQHAPTLRFAIDVMASRYRHMGIEAVVGIESRGFILGTPLAYILGTGFVPVRKKGKLPGTTITVEYDLEYGSNVLEMHTDALQAGQRVLIVDDLLATGGTMKACSDLVEQIGGKVVGLAVLIELAGLRGRDKLKGHPIHSVLKYE
jgi:adenine phosphoribosyltransferase